MTDLPTSIKKPTRWDNPFDPEITDEDITPLLDLPPLNLINQSAFPKATSLKDILRNDSRIVQYKAGDIIVRKGDYGHTVFIIISGRLRVRIGEDIPEANIGNIGPQRKSFFKIISQIWKRKRFPEERKISELKSFTSPIDNLNKISQEHRAHIDNVNEIINRYETISLYPGEIFGEKTALRRTSRNSTVFAESETKLLEIRWQGLRTIARQCANFQKHLDGLYRSRSLKSILGQIDLFNHLNDEELSEIASQVKLESFGEFEWSSSYKKTRIKDAQAAIEDEPVICKEGSFIGGLIIVSGGFVRISVKINHGHRTVGYLRKDDIFGLNEIIYNMNNEEKLPFQRSLRAIGFADVLIVPAQLVEKYIIPRKKLLYERVNKKELPLSIALPETLDTKIDPALLEILVEQRFINGTATMLIDLNRCTRCDDCVIACSLAHDNQPRFIRQGMKAGAYLIANACMHCSDPVCLTGCPTSAIYREPVGGQVVINEKTCIGCKICAKNCPYQNITMVEIRDNKNNLILDKKSSMPILKATKCDLCCEQIVSPVCEKACSHNALRRIDMANIKVIEKWIES